jgi:membrane protein
MSTASGSERKISKLTLKERAKVFLDSIKAFFAVKGLHHGAAMAYYALFAMVPLLYLSISVFGRVIGKDMMTSIISSVLKNQIGVKDPSGILVFLDTLNLEKGNFVMDVVGVITLLIACSALLVAVKTSLNKYMGINVVHISPKRALLEELLFRLISIVMIAGFTLIIIVVYFAQLFFVSLGDKWLDAQVLHWIFSGFARHGFSILSNVIIFAVILRYCHDGVVKWKLAIRGAMVTSVMLYLSQLLIKYYLANFFFAADGGIAGSILVIMAWVFYSSIIIFFGAKYTAVYAEKTGQPIVFE